LPFVRRIPGEAKPIKILRLLSRTLVIARSPKGDEAIQELQPQRALPWIAPLRSRAPKKLTSFR
jgi:hypothetical protein